MKNSEPVFNINITLQDKNTSMPFGAGSATDYGNAGSINATITTNNSLDPRNNSGNTKAFNPSDPTVSLNIPNSRIAAGAASTSNYYLPGVNTRIAGSSNINMPVYSTDDLYNSIDDARVVEYTDSDGMKQMQIMPDRIYDPINYKQQYRGDSAYRPNVCSYGTKQIVNPIYLSAEGTDLREAIENTQVGSIMPKFAYREYEDVK